MKTLIWKFWTVMTFVLMGFTAFSQEIETLWDIEVTTASKQEEKISGAPGIITVVSKDEIEGFGGTSLWDVLNRVTSMYMIHAGTYMWNIGSIRGQNVSVFDNHVLILINGRPLRDGISGGLNSVFYNSFALEGIDHIEIIRGPGSVLYGSNAYSGVINIITVKAEEKTSLETSVTYGSFNTVNVNTGGGIHVNEDLNINFGGRFYNDEGPDFGGVYDGRILKPDGTVKKESVIDTANWTRDNASAFINLNYKDFSLLAGYGEIFPFSFIPPVKWNWPTPEAGDAEKAGEEISKMKHYFTDLGYQYEINDKYTLNGNITYNGHKWEGMVNSDPKGKRAFTSNTLFELAMHGSPIEKLNFVVGGLYDHNSFEGSLFKESGNLGKYNAYIQADYKISIVKLIAGAQINKAQDMDANFSPRIGAVLNFTDNIGAKLLYSTAFRSPYPQETDVYHSSYLGNPLLEPELINTLEGQVFFQNEKAQTSITFYKSHLTDIINKIATNDSAVGNYNGTPVYTTFYNDGEFDFWGIEFEGKYSLNQKLSFFANLTYQQSEDGNGIENAAIWPDLMVKGGVIYKHEYFNAGLFNSFFGEPTQVNYMLEQMGKNPIVSKNPEATAYNLLSLNITLDLFKLLLKNNTSKVLLTLNVDNLLDESIWYPEFARYDLNSLPLHAGRSFLGKITYKL